MNILLWIIFGGIAGWIASLLIGSDAEMGITANVIVGIAGAFVGGWLADMLSGNRDGKLDAERPTSIASFVWAVIGAVILLFIFNLIW
jgi:uncharacterized membrane protein YeaQ/YmgE (transglycosylase-associated protein family)